MAKDIDKIPFWQRGLAIQPNSRPIFLTAGLMLETDCPSRDSASQFPWQTTTQACSSVWYFDEFIKQNGLIINAMTWALLSQGNKPSSAYWEVFQVVFWARIEGEKSLTLDGLWKGQMDLGLWMILMLPKSGSLRPSYQSVCESYFSATPC